MSHERLEQERKRFLKAILRRIVIGDTRPRGSYMLLTILSRFLGVSKSVFKVENVSLVTTIDDFSFLLSRETEKLMLS